MADPSNAPSSTGLGRTFSDTSAFVVVFDVYIDGGKSQSFSLTYPDSVQNVRASLVHIDTTGSTAVRSAEIPLPPGGPFPPPPDSTRDNIQVDASAGNLLVTIGDTGLGSATTGEHWELRVSADSPTNWTVTPNSGQVKIRWAAVNPVARLTVPDAQYELTPFDFTAADGIAPGNTTYVNPVIAPIALLPVPDKVTYTWNYDGGITFNEISNSSQSPTQTTGPTLKVQIPGVYGEVPVQVHLAVKLDDAAGHYGALLANTAAPAAMNIKQRRQDVVFVLDSSGSMASENRFENAKAASRVLVNMFNGLRRDLGTVDQVALVSFQDDTLGFRGGQPSDKVKTLLPLTPVKDAVTAIDDAAFDFGAPGSNTPIGDGLIHAVDLLANQTITEQKFSIILLTDGFENAGTVALDPNNATGGVITYEAAKLLGSRSGVFDMNRCSVSAIGLGPTANLDILKLVASQTNGVVKFANDARELSTGISEILAAINQVNGVQKAALPSKLPVPPSAPPAPADPDQPDQTVPNPAAPFPAVYFQTTATDDRLLVTVTPAKGATSITDTIQLAKFDGTRYQPFPVDVLSTPTDRSTSVTNLPAVGGGKTVTWRLIHGAGPSSAGQLDVDQALVYVDLHLRADVVLDKPAYQTGDKMNLTVRIRQDDKVITGATVVATLDAPAAGLGQQLATLDSTAAVASVAGNLDQPTLIEERFGALLAEQQWQTLPRTKSTGDGLFVDGTNQLFDPDGDGNYTNTFNKVFKEGLYTWHLSVVGNDVNGNAFTRALTISVFATVSVDRKATKVKVTRVIGDPNGQEAALVVITPQDKRGEHLGPGKDAEIIFALEEEGRFEHVVTHQPPPVQTDGTYQRTVVFSHKEDPIVLVRAADVLLPRIDIRDWFDGDHDDD
ncbi:vWA domain-containing protein [Kutzneria chonburiensis]|uniref:VWA domain-containing protein n=1 Tax=Kutzneria chonburiensis TaxID=1483604 RepID=A0ABV6MMK6_9PSEU|nr:vWA domain-containing protein [Kutzneria chonburiensis]